jgi:hypothetical protein
MKPSKKHTNIMQEIQNLTEEQAKLLLQYAVEDMSLVIAMPAPEIDSKKLQWLTDKITKLAKENTEQ